MLKANDNIQDIENALRTQSEKLLRFLKSLWPQCRLCFQKLNQSLCFKCMVKVNKKYSYFSVFDFSKFLKQSLILK